MGLNEHGMDHPEQREPQQRADRGRLTSSMLPGSRPVIDLAGALRRRVILRKPARLIQACPAEALRRRVLVARRVHRLIEGELELRRPRARLRSASAWQAGATRGGSLGSPM